MGQIAQYRLKPTVLRHDLADSWILKLVYIEGQHMNVLGSTRRSDGVKDRLRQILAEVDPCFFKFQDFSDLLVERKTLEVTYLLAREASLFQPVIQCRDEAGIPA